MNEKANKQSAFLEELLQASRALQTRERDFLDNLLDSSQNLETVELLRTALEPYQRVARLRALADQAAWLSADDTLTPKTREKYLTIARQIDVMVDGKDHRPKGLPTFRKADRQL